MSWREQFHVGLPAFICGFGTALLLCTIVAWLALFGPVLPDAVPAPPITFATPAP